MEPNGDFKVSITKLIRNVQNLGMKKQVWNMASCERDLPSLSPPSWAIDSYMWDILGGTDSRGWDRFSRTKITSKNVKKRPKSRITDITLTKFSPLKGKKVCICLVEFSFGGGKEDFVPPR